MPPQSQLQPLPQGRPTDAQLGRQGEPSGDGTELSLTQLLDFAIEHYKKCLLAALLGGILGFGAWHLLGTYQAQVTLINSPKGDVGLDLVSWRTIQKSLPNLADQMVEQSKAPQGSLPLYRQMSEPTWWQKNAQPSFVLTKADLKDLASVGKELDSAGTSILGITITTQGDSATSAKESARQAAQFLLAGGAYLQIKGLLNTYESEAIATKAQLEQQVSASQVELSYLAQRANNLERLHKRFGADQGADSRQQVIDPKDSGAKYLPLSTQMVAINTEINQQREALARLNDRLSQIAITSRFLAGALEQAQDQFDGVLLARQLLVLEGQVRETLAPQDNKSRLPLDQLRARLLAIEARFTKGLEPVSSPKPSKRGMLKTTLGGALLVTLLALGFLVGRPWWRAQFKVKGVSVA